MRLDERHEIGVLAELRVVLDEHALVLQADDRDPVPVVGRERGDAEAERRARAQLLAGRGGLAPVESVYGPWQRGSARVSRDDRMTIVRERARMEAKGRGMAGERMDNMDHAGNRQAQMSSFHQESRPECALTGCLVLQRRCLCHDRRRRFVFVGRVIVPMLSLRAQRVYHRAFHAHRRGVPMHTDRQRRRHAVESGGQGGRGRQPTGASTEGGRTRLKVYCSRTPRVFNLRRGCRGDATAWAVSVWSWILVVQANIVSRGGRE